MIRFGDLVKEKRAQSGLSLREFSHRCGLSHSFIKNLEDGDPRTGKDITPTLNSLEKLAPVLDITIENTLKKIGFLGENNEENDPAKSEPVQGEIKYEEISNELDKNKTFDTKDGYTGYPDLQYYIGETNTYTIHEELKEFVFNPENEEYIRLAQELCDKGIKVKFIRDILLAE